MHAPPVGCQTQWHTVVELSSKLKQILQEESWQVHFRCCKIGVSAQHLGKLVNKHNLRVFYALQSVDSLRASTPLSALDHLRLRGGAPPGKGKKKPEALQQQASKPTKLAKATASPKGQQGADLMQTEADHEPPGSTRLPAASIYQYHIGDSVEVRFAHGHLVIG